LFKELKVVLHLQDRQQEGSSTCTLLPSEIEGCYCFCTIVDNMTMKDYFQEHITTELPSVSTSHIPNIRVRMIYPWNHPWSEVNK
jgi:hypothetical protein